MGLFSKKPDVKIDPVLDAAIPDGSEMTLKNTRRRLEGTQAIIQATLAQDEVPTCVVGVGTTSPHGVNRVLVVTDRRVVLFKKDSIAKQFRHDQVAETKVGELEGGILVRIISHSSMLDFAPSDPSRTSQIMSFRVVTPRIGFAVCAAVDAHL